MLLPVEEAVHKGQRATPQVTWIPVISSKPTGAGRWGVSQTPAAPQLQSTPLLSPVSFQTSLPGSPVSGWNPKSGVGLVQSSRLVQSSLGPDGLGRYFSSLCPWPRAPLGTLDHRSCCWSPPGLLSALRHLLLLPPLPTPEEEAVQRQRSCGPGQCSQQHHYSPGEEQKPVPHPVLAHSREGNARSRPGSSG